MKRLVFAFAVLALVACAKQEAVPAADTTAVAPAAAPAVAVDTTAVAVPADTTKRR